MGKISDKFEAANPEEARRLIKSVVREVTEALSRTPPIPEEIAGYRVLGLLGRGGMGLVYRAEQQSPKRIVALKILASECLTRERIRRFSFEAEFLGRLQHPGIARIYEAGVAETAEGRRPYLAMELVEDAQTITCYVREHRLDARECLELIADVCDAVEHAHQKGIIHRDLKPGNIMINPTGQAKILDFGVARATDSDIEATTLTTSVCHLVGTIPYMSPEQASGNNRDIDTRSDVYAIGIIMYQLLAGCMPYSIIDQSPSQMLRTICEEHPSRLSSIDRSLRGDVEIMVLKALEKNREHRYQSAAALGDDIRRYLNQQTILARSPSKVYQLRRFASQNKLLIAGVVAVILALSLGGVGVAHQAANTSREVKTSIMILRMFLESNSRLSSAWLDDPENVEFLNELSDGAERLFPDDPECEARMRNFFGGTFLELGDTERAELEFRRHFRLMSEIYGPRNERTLRAYDMLIDALLSADKLEIAKNLIDEGLTVAGYGEGVVRDVGAEEWSFTLALRTLRLRYKLAVTLHHLGRVDEAEQVLRQTLNELDKVLDETPWLPNDHDNVAEVRWSLALLLLDQQKDAREAIDLLNSVVDFHDRINHNQLSHALVRVHLAEALFANRDIDGARSELDQAEMTSMHTVFAQDPVLRLHLLRVRGEIIMDTDPTDAKPFLREALRIQEKRKPGHWRTTLVRTRYAECLALLGHIADAIIELESARKVLLERFGEDDYRTKRVRARLLDLHSIESGAR